jgi:ribonuclease H2 subunit C
VNTAYFRGRKLKGKTVTLPEEYRGVVVERKADEKQEPPIPEDAEEQPVEIGAMQVTAGFDEMVVWGHENVASAEADPYIRSVEEWLQVAEKVCTGKKSDEYWR